MSDCRKARILPQNVFVRQTTKPETIERDGRKIGVRPGNYIIRDNFGILWQCSEETFKHCYAEGWEEAD